MDQTIKFKEMFKEFIDSDFFGAVNFSDIIVVLLVTLAIALFIFLIYKQTYSGIMYNHSFNVTLVLMALITATIISTISSNLVLSLGMVGALSIVRFRTPVKDPLDIVFIFWAISVGITAGAKLYTVALTGSLLIGIVAVLLLRYKNTNDMFLMIVHCEQEAKENLNRSLANLDYTLKSKTVSDGFTEYTFEIKLVGMDTSFVENLSDIEGVKSVSLVSYSGNFVG